MSYTLLGPDGAYQSEVPGTLGGNKKDKIYGRLDCPSAARWIEKGHYVAIRVFFADEETAIATGYRPCARCLPEKYREWKR
jgi:methylphosphotriester-DNA--protein-cysteine methyltransferase